MASAVEAVHTRLALGGGHIGSGGVGCGSIGSRYDCPIRAILCRGSARQ